MCEWTIITLGSGRALKINDILKLHSESSIIIHVVNNLQGVSCPAAAECLLKVN